MVLEGTITTVLPHRRPAAVVSDYWAKGQLGPIRDTTTAALRWGRTVEMVPPRHHTASVISDYGSVGIRELRIRLDG